MWGTSTHNTRIERLWGEVGRQFMRHWRAFFFRLEEQYGLSQSNPALLWLICELFLPMIDEECKQFVRRWNRHSIENSSIGHMSPNVSAIAFSPFSFSLKRTYQDLYFLGQVQHGVYKAAPRDAYLTFDETSSTCSSVIDLENDGFSVDEFDHLDGDDWQGIGDERFDLRRHEEQANETLANLEDNVSGLIFHAFPHFYLMLRLATRKRLWN